MYCDSLVRLISYLDFFLRAMIGMSQRIYDKRWEQKFILPEQRAALLNRKREVQKIEKPILDEYQLEDMARTICEGIQLGSGHQYIQRRIYLRCNSACALHKRSETEGFKR